MHPDEQKLRNAGYITKRFTPFHFQVKKKGGADIVNVWPTAGKLLKKFQPGPAAHYMDVVSAVEKLLSRKTLKEQAAELRNFYPRPAPVPEFDYWQEYMQILIKSPPLFAEYLESIR